MSEPQFINAPDIRDALLSAYLVSTERARLGRSNEEKIRKWSAELAQVNNRIDSLTACFNHSTKIYKNIKEHEAERREAAFQMFNRAITEVAKIIPDANMRGMQLKVTESNKVKIVNEKDQDINLREGGAARTLTGVLLRYTCLSENTDALNMMLFDESFFTLSDTTTVEFRRRLEELSKKTLIIVVEQRRNVADGIVDMEYEFVKDENGVTTVRCTDLRVNKNGN